MNILILISSFLVILALGVYTLSKESIAAMQSQAHFETFLDLEKKAHNTIQRRLYRLASNKKPKKETEQKEKKEKILLSRNCKTPTEQAKFNLTFLFVELKPSPYLYEIAASLLRNLYKGTEIEKMARKQGVSDFEHLLLDALIETGKKEKEPITFASLVPETAPLKELYAKMVKGTRLYDLATHKGYPPLSDFFTLDSKQKKPIFFCFMPPVVVKAVFGEALGQHILDQETNGPLEKKELEALLLDYGDPKMQFTNVEPFLNFSRKRSVPKKITVQDKHKPIFKKQIKVS